MIRTAEPSPSNISSSGPLPALPSPFSTPNDPPPHEAEGITRLDAGTRGATLASCPLTGRITNNQEGSPMNTRKTRVAGMTGLIVLCLASTTFADKHLGERIRDSKAVYQELLSSPDRTVPQDLLKNAKCVAVI